MTTIQLLACIGMITGFFLLLGLAPMEFTDGLFSFLIREKNERYNLMVNAPEHKAKLFGKAGGR